MSAVVVTCSGAGASWVEGFALVGASDLLPVLSGFAATSLVVAGFAGSVLVAVSTAWLS